MASGAGVRRTALADPDFIDLAAVRNLRSRVSAAATAHDSPISHSPA
jgi:hypothetical protein